MFLSDAMHHFGSNNIISLKISNKFGWSFSETPCSGVLYGNTFAHGRVAMATDS